MTNEKCPAAASGEPEPGRILDLTLPLAPETAPWPGDPALEIRRLSSLAAGESSLTHQIGLGLHLGTHLDAPAHVLPGGAWIGDLPPDLFLGSAWVADLSAAQGREDDEKQGENGLVRPGAPGSGTVPAQAPGSTPPRGQNLRGIGIPELEAANIRLPCPRLLLKTGLARKPGVFPLEFRALSPEAARWCLDRGVRLLGMDTPSPDPADSPDLPAHRILLGAGVPLLENLDLSGVAAGEYMLSCLPLRLEGLEASPARAVIWR